MHDWYHHAKRWLNRFTWYVPVRISPFPPRPFKDIEIYSPDLNIVAMTAPPETVRRMWYKGKVVWKNGRFYLVFPEISEEELNERLREIDRIVRGEEEELMSEEEG